MSNTNDLGLSSISYAADKFYNSLIFLFDLWKLISLSSTPPWWAMLYCFSYLLFLLLSLLFSLNHLASCSQHELDVCYHFPCNNTFPTTQLHAVLFNAMSFDIGLKFRILCGILSMTSSKMNGKKYRMPICKEKSFRYFQHYLKFYFW